MRMSHRSQCGESPIARRRPTLIVLGLLALGGISLPATSQTMDWVGTASSSWTNGLNWSPVGPPGPSDDVFLDTVSPSATLIDGVNVGTVSDLTIGDTATGGLTLQNAGEVTSTGSGYIGADGTASGSVGVHGGSRWTNDGNLWVGLAGTGTLEITGGGVVTSTGSSAVGNQSTAIGDVTVSGAGSNWTNSVPSGVITIGAAGQGTLKIELGGSVIDSGGRVGSSAGAEGSVLVTDPASIWSHSGSLVVGDRGHGQMSVEAGGAVESDSGTVGNLGDGLGEVTVTGPGSSWTMTGPLSVGAQGGTGALTVVDGGTVEALHVTLGDFSGEGSVVIDGATSTLDVSGDLTVGRNASGSFAALRGAQVAVTGDVAIALEAGSDGTLTLDSLTTLAVGGAYTHRAGGTYQVGIAPGGTAGLVDVTGAATLEGGTVVVDVEPGIYVPGTELTLLSAAGGVLGSFDQLVIQGDASLSLQQDANRVYLVVLEPSVLEIPTLSTWSLIVLAGSLAWLGLGWARRD